MNATDRKDETALVRLDPQALLARAVETGAGIETLERLVALAKDVRAQQAREAWYHAMAEFQRRCPAILKTSTAKIATKSGSSYRYSYAPLSEITGAMYPVAADLGLSVSWRRVNTDAGQVGYVCRISHELGHVEESGEILMPVSPDDGKGAGPQQRVAIATTYAQRYALRAIAGIVPQDDDDTDAEGEKEPKPEVAMPQRASERKADAPPSATAEGFVWSGIIATVKDYKTKKGKTFWVVTGEGNAMTFTTFSASIMVECCALIAKDAEIAYTENATADGKTYRNIDAVRRME